MATPLAALAPYRQWFGRDEQAVLADLESFSALLRRWNETQNLVSRETLPNLWNRHIIDSLQLLPFVPASNTEPLRLLDIGSGGGLPALPLAIALKGRPVAVTLVEPVQKKVAFLRTVIRQLDLAAVVHAGRVQTLDSRETPQVITSRALAALPELFDLIEPFVGPETVAVLPKGKDHAVELAESHLAWSFDVVISRSVTDERSAVLAVRNLVRKSVL